MCKVTPSQIAADGNAVAQACNSIAAILEATNPTLAADLRTAATALQAATANWKTGDPTDDINTAGIAVEAVLAAIPMTAPYAAFVAIAVAALDVILANTATQAAQEALPPSSQPVAKALLIKDHVETALPDNPYRGMVHIHRMPWEGPRTALVNAWNKEVEKVPEVGIPKLK
jgi:hypothetical protein